MNNNQTRINQSLKLFFGIFMVFVYLGMSWLMITNFFNWTNTPTWTAIRWFFALVFGVYGLYRGYREFRGEHTYGMRKYDDNEDAQQYGTYEKDSDIVKSDENNDEK